jgi:hypothetical protein
LSKSYQSVLLAEDDYKLARDQYEKITGKAEVDGEPLEQVQDFNATRDFDKVTFKDGKAKSVIEEIYNTIQDDEDFVS